MTQDVIRVSTVLALLYPNSLQFVQQDDLDRGTALHEEMELWANNVLYGYRALQRLSPECKKMARWLTEQGVEIQSTEEQFSHKYGFSGRPDLLGIWNTKEYWFDYKFSESVTEQNRMQGNAYTELTSRPGVFLQCPKGGPVKPVRCKKDPLLLSAFLNGLGVKKFHLSKGLT